MRPNLTMNWNKTPPNEKPFTKHNHAYYRFRSKHLTRDYWWKTGRYVNRPFVINFFEYTPRVMMDRDLFREEQWEEKHRMPDTSRWEKIVNGKRVLEDRWALVEEDGEMHKVNWRLYSKRLESEIKAAYDNVPQWRHQLDGLPVNWERLDPSIAVARNLSVREAIAQGKLDETKHRQIMGRVIEIAQASADGKGLDKDKLRVTFADTFRGKRDQKLHLKSKGYYAWGSIESSNVRVVLAEDPEMVPPDRSVLPYVSQLNLKRAGIPSKNMGEMIDVPAITAEGI